MESKHKAIVIAAMWIATAAVVILTRENVALSIALIGTIVIVAYA